MPVVRRFLARLKSTLLRGAREREMQEEMRLHLEHRVREHEAKGLNHAAAVHAAQREFGGAEQMRELARDERRLRFLEDWARDLRGSFRSLRRSPGFAVVAILSLGIGIGANTTIFSLLDEVLLESLPVKDPNSLVLLTYTSVGGAPQGLFFTDGMHDDKATGAKIGDSLSPIAFKAMGKANETLIDLFAFTTLYANVAVGGVGEMSHRCQFVSGGYFDGLGVMPILGRLIAPADDKANAPGVVVISEGVWESRFGSASNAVGQTVLMNNHPLVVIGVTPRRFTGAGEVAWSPDYSVPLAQRQGIAPLPDWAQQNPATAWWLKVMGRMKPAKTREDVRMNLAGTFDRANERDGPPAKGEKERPRAQLKVESGARGLDRAREDYARQVRVLAGLVGLVLAIACTNVAGLLIARGAARRKEFGVRLALGADRWRLVRQLLIESAVLAGFGAILGVGFAYWGRDLLLALHPFGLATALKLEINGLVLGFTAAVSVLSALLFGLIPAIASTKLDLVAQMSGAGSSGSPRGLFRVGQGILVLQIALSVVLLVGAGLFVRTLINLRAVDVGFDRTHLLLFRLDPTSAGLKSEELPDLNDRITAEIGVLPGVIAVTSSSYPILSGQMAGFIIGFDGFVSPDAEKMKVASFNSVAPGFFSTLRVPRLLGRDFDGRDSAKASPVTIVNEAFVRKFIGERNPLGIRVRSYGEIVGVVRDIKAKSPKEKIGPMLYTPLVQRMNGQLNFVVRSSGDPAGLANAVRQAVRRIDARLPISDLRTQDEQVERLAATEILFARVSAGFGVVVLLLVCIGLYGLFSYAVTRRTREIGIRSALGAWPAALQAMILRESASLVAAGIVLGVAAALALVRSVAAFFYGVTGTDVTTYVVVSTGLLVVSLAATWTPARRAARVDPLRALRVE